MTKKEKLLKLIKHNPVQIAHLLGYTDMNELHNKWLQEMIFSQEDKTILAHRGSFKTTCLSVAIALMIVLYPKKKIIFFFPISTKVLHRFPSHVTISI